MLRITMIVITIILTRLTTNSSMVWGAKSGKLRYETAGILKVALSTVNETTILGSENLPCA